MPGSHNVLNALSAVAVGMEVGLDFSTIQKALSGFTGVGRRFQIKGEAQNITIVDDYGHHPSEIIATLTAARNFWEGKLIAVFQPHRYTRTRDLFDDFLTAFYAADILFMTEIYPAGEDPIPGVEGQRLFEGIRERGMKEAYFIPAKRDLARELLKAVKSMKNEKIMIITLGAGDIYRVGEELLAMLEEGR
jgi:UDP-N-acetylmuramate--alanine ligase